MAAQTHTTQRAYTLRLRSGTTTPSSESDESWRQAVWATHEAINKGAKAFGDWLLTLRGGLDHTLANTPNKKGQKPSEPEMRDRRVLLALSWLSVEDERGAPKESGVIVAYGDDCKAAKDSQDGRDRKLVDALRGILNKRGMKAAEIDGWVSDCEGSLKARIRDDAVWVNRSAAFDELSKSWRELTRVNAASVLEEFFGSAVEWVSLPARADSGDDEEEDTASGGADGGGGDGEEFRTKARSFLSLQFGSGAKGDKQQIGVALLRAAKAVSGLRAGITGNTLLRKLCEEFSLSADDTDEARSEALRVRIGWKTGRKSKGRLALDTYAAKGMLSREELDALAVKLQEEAAEKKAEAGKPALPWIADLRDMIEKHVGFGFVVERDLIGEHGVMLDHAARRVSITCSWIKLAELERRQFELDAEKLDAVRAEHPRAVQLLTELAVKRGRDSGASEGRGVLVRGRALQGWKEVVAKWCRKDCRTAEQRVKDARDLQDELEKFGDINLFTTLASQDFEQVWHRGDMQSGGDPTILARYVAGTVAQMNQQRFKVPAYRHPDPLRHPVFGDFGVSRWDIGFALHESVLAKNSGKRVGKLDGQWHADPRNMRMGLWTGQRVEAVNLCWSSKRLASDLALSEGNAPDAGVVTRADRLGRAAAGHPGPVGVLSVFAEDNWNGRLQAPRAELNRIARLLNNGKKEQAKKLLARINWLVSFSPKLAPSGPFIEYAAVNGIEPNKKDGSYWPNSKVNNPGKEANARKGHAKLIYARLPALRVLSVDLGHRYAASCAVWETLSASTFKKAVGGGTIVHGGSGADDLYCQIRSEGEDGKKRMTVYRRIAGGKLADSKAHPAPWARLDRQFLIKLQGEDEPARKAGPDELANLARWEKTLGVQPRATEAQPLSRNIVEVMARSVRLAAMAGRRHNDRARIAHNLVAKTRTKPGGVSQELDEEGKIELLTETLALWHGLFAGDKWSDDFAKNLWKQYGLPEGLALPQRGESDVSSFSRVGRRAAAEAYIQTLRPHAERLAKSDLGKLSKIWSDRWLQDDRTWEDRGKKSGLMRELRRWIVPRGLRITKRDEAAGKARKTAAATQARHVGGLSIDRINTITALYRLLKSFKNRPEPDNLRKNIPEKGDGRLLGFHQRLLDTRDRLREQRVKQLASRIVEAALGVGRMKRPNAGKDERKSFDPARPTVRVDEPCHCVVIESLANYRPDELQTRRENRQLMDWSSSKVQKYLAESCQLFGLHLREVQPNYTSRQCSRTGAPGLRCVEVSAHDLLNTPWWKKDIERSRKKTLDGGDARDRLLKSAGDWAADLRAGVDPKNIRVVLPKMGGDLFVSLTAKPNDEGRFPAVQADLNAAANIGLRALLDPDWSGKWWFVPCTGGTYAPSPDRTKGSAVWDQLEGKPLPNRAGDRPSEIEPGKRKKAKASSESEKAIENRWRHVSSDPVNEGEWMSTGEYWSRCVVFPICEGLQRQFR